MERKVAILDLGTNTFHLILARISNGQFSILLKDRKSVLLGKGGINNQLITGEAELRALDALREFRHIIDQHQINEIYTTATSAFRNARNSHLLVNKIKAEFNFEVRVISGLEEAKYIYKGVKNAINLGSDAALIMDIGGGSCEFIIADNSDILWMESYEIGAQRLMDRFLRNDPIINSEIEKINQYLENELKSLIDAMHHHSTSQLIGASGSFDTLSDIYRMSNSLPVNGQLIQSELPIEDFFKIYDNIISFDHEARLAIPGMIAMRADMIVVASILIRFVISNYKFRNILVSSYALKEGILAELVES